MAKRKFDSSMDDKDIETKLADMTKELEILKSAGNASVIKAKIWSSDLPILKKQELFIETLKGFGDNLFSMFSKEMESMEEATENIKLLENLSDGMQKRAYIFIGKIFSEVSALNLYKEKYETVEDYAQKETGFERTRFYRLKDAWDFFYSKIKFVARGQQITERSIRQAIPLLKSEKINEKYKTEIIDCIVENYKLAGKDLNDKLKEKIKTIEVMEKIKLTPKKEKKEKIHTNIEIAKINFRKLANKLTYLEFIDFLAVVDEVKTLKKETYNKITN